MGNELRLQEAIELFKLHLRSRNLSLNTRRCFLSDLGLFQDFLNLLSDEPASMWALSRIKREHVRAFIEHEERRKGANSPKSVERRLTSLKVFFRWLHKRNYLPLDIAADVPYKPAAESLPTYLTEAQVQAVLEAARVLAAGPRADTRPLAIIHLILDTGIKKSECLRLTLEDVSLSERMIHVRYPQRHLKFKERDLPISEASAIALEQHLARFRPQRRLFECTGRNLEYLFNRKVAPLAGLSSLTFEMLRWTCAMREYRRGNADDLRMQTTFGLSEIGWAEMEAKLKRLLAREAAQIT
ncbi:MAG: tyrosine-type recombinase/integrase [Thermoflexales bacterium]